jgi:hypothetical protein
MIYALLGFAVVALAAVMFVVHWGMKAKDGQIAASTKAGDERALRMDANAKQERTAFELEQTKQALAAESKRADALEEVLRDEVNESPNPDLARTDVRGRLLRVARSWGEANRPGGSVPADPAKAVPDIATTERTDAPDVPAHDKPDV